MKQNMINKNTKSESKIKTINYFINFQIVLFQSDEVIWDITQNSNIQNFNGNLIVHWDKRPVSEYLSTMIDESVKMEASSNNTVNFAEGFKSQVIPSLKTALLNPSSEQVKSWKSYLQNQVQRIFEIIWLQDLVLVCQSGKELRSSTLLIAAIFPWVFI